LRWNEVNSDLNPGDFTIKNIFRRLGQIGDIFKDVMGKGINIEKSTKILEKKYRIHSD
jgi:bifunctional non-homologous end joining protein LigD